MSATTAGPVTARTGRSGESAARRSRGTVLYVTAGVLSIVVFVVPLLWAVFRSFQPSDLVTAYPAWKDFSHLTFSNYSAIFGGDIDLWRYVANSLMVALGTGVLVTIVSTLAGYGLARFRFRGSNFVFAVILVTFMVPFQAVLTPLFLELGEVGLTDSRFGLILFYTTFNLPFGVFVMRNTFLSVPTELEDSARMDGAGTLRVLALVLRPLFVPGAATTMLYAFLASWTDFLGALTFLTKNNLLTLPVGLYNLEAGNFGELNYGYLMAGAVISMIPCVVLFVALQRYYVRGLTSGALKG
jgi:multiple sugar transport system permease protein